MKQETKPEIVRRLKVASGHLNKVIGMVETDRYCIDVLQQTAAVKGSLDKIEEIILDSHMRTCVAPSFKGSKPESAIKELMEVFRRR